MSLRNDATVASTVVCRASGTAPWGSLCARGVAAADRGGDGNPGVKARCRFRTSEQSPCPHVREVTVGSHGQTCRA